MKVLVTGGAGYIGCVLVEELLKSGNDVIVVDKFLFGKNLLPQHPNLKLINFDVRDIDESEFLFLGLNSVDAIIDLVAISNDPAGEAFSKETN